jgi:hypothetical protein
MNDHFKNMSINKNDTGSLNTLSSATSTTAETTSQAFGSNQTVITHDSVNLRLITEHEDNPRNANQQQRTTVNNFSSNPMFIPTGANPTNLDNGSTPALQNPVGQANYVNTDQFQNVNINNNGVDADGATQLVPANNGQENENYDDDDDEESI